MALRRGPWAYISAAVRRWMDPNGDGDPADGIDGWRLDVAEQVTEPSWRKFRTLGPLGESRKPTSPAKSGGKNGPRKCSMPGPWLQGDMFDAVMNYRFANAVTKFFINQEQQISASEFDAELAQVRADYPKDASFVLQNLMGQSRHRSPAIDDRESGSLLRAHE